LSCGYISMISSVSIALRIISAFRPRC
jgi:hypothetical protein